MAILKNLEPGLIRYRDLGIEPGSFLMAALEGDIDMAEKRADPESLAHLEETLGWIALNMPYDSWGSPGKVKAWIKHRGMEGLRDRHPNTAEVGYEPSL